MWRRRVLEWEFPRSRLPASENPTLEVLLNSSHGHFVAREVQLVVFQNKLAPRAGDFKAVRARRFAGGGDKYAGRAVGYSR